MVATEELSNPCGLVFGVVAVHDLDWCCIDCYGLVILESFWAVGAESRTRSLASLAGPVAF